MSYLNALSRPVLPERYREDWPGPYRERILGELKPGVSLLDVGAGCAPSVPLELRPDGIRYVGLDLSEAELIKAGPGAYTDYRVGDVLDLQPDFLDRFDVVTSWQVLEHVKSLDTTFANIYRYLKPGGRFIAQFSGTFSVFGLANQAVPANTGPWLLKTMLGRDPQSVFPAYYDHCWHDKIEKALSGWSEVEIIPRYRGAGYWSFAPPLQKLYLAYENWAVERRRLNLATHYLIDARR